jgi:hypothetical protein
LDGLDTCLSIAGETFFVADRVVGAICLGAFFRIAGLTRRLNGLDRVSGPVFETIKEVHN